jgi:diguanylate cyclase (GGDEF)-like protein
MAFQKQQNLNQWVEMLDQIYGGTQNYSKSVYEIHAHLTEVCGIYANHLFKRRDPDQAARFLPRIFAWAVALLKKARPGKTDLEEIVLRKFPGVCPYCTQKPCACWLKDKPTLDQDGLTRLYFQNASSIRRTANDFQLMFREIYGASWAAGESPQRSIFIHLIEELAELAEAIRFQHLYPENFENELADFFAWWFALASSASAEPPALVADLLWIAYPGMCLDCQILPCFCRPGPVREVMSKPLVGQGHRFDALTNTYNQGAYKQDLLELSKGELQLPTPLACARIDVDRFKNVNTVHGHAAGDAALRHIAAVLQRKTRERDRVYRVGGDEFAVIFSDFTAEEASGALSRACAELAQKPVRWVDASGKATEFLVSISVGVQQCVSSSDVEAAFERADAGSYASKAAGKGPGASESSPNHTANDATAEVDPETQGVP